MRTTIAHAWISWLCNVLVLRPRKMAIGTSLRRAAPACCHEMVPAFDGTTVRHCKRPGSQGFLSERG